jgi:hypothetical protein
VGGNTATFRINDQFGTVGIAGSSDGVSTFTGTYNPGFGINATITRTFSLVPGQNILRIDTVLTSVTAATFRFFDTYDPDQGIGLGDGFVTSNDRFTLGPFEVLRAVADVGSGASAPYTVIMGSTKPEGFLSGDLGISDGTELNNFFNSGGGIDPNNAVADIGMTLAWSIAASAGVPIRFSSFQSYGATPAAAAALPEPGTLLLLGGGLAGVARRLRRRQRS